MSPLEQLISREALTGIKRMFAYQEASHSFNMFRPACEHQPAQAYTFLMLLVPSDLDAEIYEALKPIVEGRCGPGTLVMASQDCGPNKKDS